MKDKFDVARKENEELKRQILEQEDKIDKLKIVGAS